ncbi:hypothetical protein CPB83DRAFT_894569 [Crepidotus variabilis]|uniref:Uncharacterized protein n=1 Tax=Crepidotus variabilis TaxID=179855 RepID=A0A9P6JPL9_9AGAR|nr:hypothetical protein CPB83DRAFT_894569 [Crepidotus variabilis]
MEVPNNISEWVSESKVIVIIEVTIPLAVSSRACSSGTGIKLQDGLELSVHVVRQVHLPAGLFAAAPADSVPAAPANLVLVDLAVPVLQLHLCHQIDLVIPRALDARRQGRLPGRPPPPPAPPPPRPPRSPPPEPLRLQPPPFFAPSPPPSPPPKPPAPPLTLTAAALLT